MIYYRVSDNSYKKIRLPGSGKWSCFFNFRTSFPENIEIIADNCNPETLEIFSKTGITTHVTNHSNAGSLVTAIGLAMRLPADEIVYFVEDDYLHHPDASMNLIRQGLTVADYVTLYDHPDKYTEMYDYGEVSKVVKTESSHWRYTISTCMTFATTAGVLANDLEVWRKYTQGTHPNDHGVFSELKMKGKKLALCIPGMANHCDMIFPQERWAVDQMLSFTMGEVDICSDPMIHIYREEIMKMDESPINKLKMIHGILHRV